MFVEKIIRLLPSSYSKLTIVLCFFILIFSVFLYISNLFLNDLNASVSAGEIKFRQLNEVVGNIKKLRKVNDDAPLEIERLNSLIHLLAERKSIHIETYFMQGGGVVIISTNINFDTLLDFILDLNNQIGMPISIVEIESAESKNGMVASAKIITR
ncbi:hypothetical protein AXW38_03250 [Yersinia ruckeri]|uniref:hypothetical protein n=1 Tax=Yersinia ruckeri TaxID=29486 RepID=UPI0004E43BCF|nr:hypothetical protein [Yersinia ruckeri]ARY99996.1 hypothetical protein QMA0440_00631 [Yersinia ruckeri]ELI6452794.1 hypothetical protein [Yersinia ruckeri]KFE40457.1 hypothetical protein nADLYRO1b_227 [Yersinia ruckeri]MCK8565183.1 hypothetical protein [Yersinia ruckeri]OIX31368.1 hypothetical protein AXW18_03245 [Yersinia ruckeri]